MIQVMIRSLVCVLLAALCAAILACAQQGESLPDCDPALRYFDARFETYSVRDGKRSHGGFTETRYDGAYYHRVEPSQQDGQERHWLWRDGEMWEWSEQRGWRFQSTSDYFGRVLPCGPALHSSGRYMYAGQVFSLLGDVDLDGVSVRHFESVALSEHAESTSQLWVDDGGYLVRLLVETPHDGAISAFAGTLSDFGEPNDLPPLPVASATPVPEATATPEVTSTARPLSYAERPTPTPVRGECGFEGRIPEREIYDHIERNLTDSSLPGTLDVSLVEAGWVQSRGYWIAKGTVCNQNGHLYESEWTGTWSSDCRVGGGGSSSSLIDAPPDNVCVRIPTPTPSPTPFPHPCVRSWGTVDSTTEWDFAAGVRTQLNISTNGYFQSHCRSAVRPGSNSWRFTVDLRTPTAFSVEIQSEQDVHVYVVASHGEGPVVAEGGADGGDEFQLVVVQEEPLQGPHTIVVATRHRAVEGRFSIDMDDLTR